MIEDYSPKWKPKKKRKQIIITKSIKKNNKKDRESIIEIFLKIRKLKKEIMLTMEIKTCQMKIVKEKRIYERLLLQKKILNPIEELENVSINI